MTRDELIDAVINTWRTDGLVSEIAARRCADRLRLAMLNHPSTDELALTREGLQRLATEALVLLGVMDTLLAPDTGARRAYDRASAPLRRQLELLHTSVHVLPPDAGAVLASFRQESK